MTTLSTIDRHQIDQVWTALATARVAYWEDKTLNRAIDLIAWRLQGDYTIDQLGAALIAARERAATALGVPPWNG